MTLLIDTLTGGDIVLSPMYQLFLLGVREQDRQVKCGGRESTAQTPGRIQLHPDIPWWDAAPCRSRCCI